MQRNLALMPSNGSDSILTHPALALADAQFPIGRPIATATGRAEKLDTALNQSDLASWM